MAGPRNRYLGIEYLAPFGQGGGRARSHPVHYTLDGGKTALCGKGLSRAVKWRVRIYSNPDYKPEQLCPACETRAAEELEKAWEREKERKQLAKVRTVDTKTLVKALRQRGVMVSESVSSEPGHDVQDIDQTDRRKTPPVDQESLVRLTSKLRETQAAFQGLEDALGELLEKASATVSEVAEFVESLSTDTD